MIKWLIFRTRSGGDFVANVNEIKGAGAFFFKPAQCWLYQGEKDELEGAATYHGEIMLDKHPCDCSPGALRLKIATAADWRTW